MPQEAVIKQENEIQSYINSFKEMEEADEAAGTSRKAPSESKIFITEEGSDQEVAITTEEGGDDEEYKYVFIVQDDEEMDEKGNNEGGEEQIYEFEDFGEDDDMLEEIQSKPKTVKLTPVSKKSAAGSQGGGANHMCSFCNYTTNKRYLLARHMKVRIFQKIRLA